jgi:hypothetical protein
MGLEFFVSVFVLLLRDWSVFVYFKGTSRTSVSILS